MLEVRNLIAGYGKVQVLHQLSISVAKGQLVTLIGSNAPERPRRCGRSRG